MNDNTILISQHGKDGFGHQLHGLFTVLICHESKNYYFDSNHFLTKKFSFQHLTDSKEIEQAKLYLKEIVSLFSNSLNLKKTNSKFFIHSHEIYKIPQNNNIQTTYTLDNVFGFESHFDKVEKNHIYDLVEKIKPFFVNSFLPPCNLKEKNIVFHLRMGDALRTFRGKDINIHNQNVKKLIDLLLVKYPDYHFYIHSDGDVKNIFEKVSDKNKTFCPKDTKLLNVLSDFINSNIFVSSVSSLSTVCTFLGNRRQLTIVPDSPGHTVFKNSIRISDYIKNFNEIN